MNFAERVSGLEMKKMSFLNSNEVVCENCWQANTVSSRFLGLMGIDSVPSSNGILIYPCNSIHTFFMKIKIDVLYLDSSMKVLKIQKSAKPWRFFMPVLKAQYVLEMAEGNFEKLKVGDQLCLS